MMQTALLKCTLILVIVVAIVNQSLWFRFKSLAPFDRLLSVANLYIGFHALFVLGVEHFLLTYPLYDRLAPFSLMYGPLLYFAFFIIHRQHIESRRLLLHSSPFVLFTLVYIILVILGFPEYPVKMYIVCFFPTTMLSFVSYTIWAFVYNSKPIKKQLKQHKLIVLISVIVLLFAAMVMSAGIFSSRDLDNLNKSVGLLRFLMYGCLLCFVLTIHRFYRLVLKKQASEPVIDIGFSSVNESDNKYEKSFLVESQLEVYLDRLEQLMAGQQVYLHQDLSLLKLAQLTRIPKHHITQVLNLKLKMNFYEYVNGFRVRHACLLFKENSVDTIESIAEQSGFNSKVSFNRHFKALKGLTPSEYRLNNVK